MNEKGIGPQGLGTKGNSGYPIGSPAKQTADPLKRLAEIKLTKKRLSDENSTKPKSKTRKVKELAAFHESRSARAKGF
jgi:hypothetical protein